MQILKHGDAVRIRNVKRTVRFDCKACGCVFNADRHEYTIQEIPKIPTLSDSKPTTTGIPYIVIACPDCGSLLIWKCVKYNGKY